MAADKGPGDGLREIADRRRSASWRSRPQTTACWRANWPRASSAWRARRALGSGRETGFRSIVIALKGLRDGAIIAV